MSNMENIVLRFLSDDKNSKLYMFDTQGDGSCFFHSIMMAMSKDYKESYGFNRRLYVKRLRRQLSELLPSVRYNGITWYESLSNGQLREMSRSISRYKLTNMVKELESSASVSNLYNEFVSEVLNIDIYLIDVNRLDLYFTGDDVSLLIKNRNSIVIAYLDDEMHYQTVGYEDGDNVFTTLFDPDHDLIVDLKQRISEQVT